MSHFEWLITISDEEETSLTYDRIFDDLDLNNDEIDFEAKRRVMVDAVNLQRKKISLTADTRSGIPSLQRRYVGLPHGMQSRFHLVCVFILFFYHSNHH